MSTRTFNCYTQHMLDTLSDVASDWKYPGGSRCLIVREFFKRAAAKRPGSRFDIHGSVDECSTWKHGDVINFVVQGTKSVCVRAVLDRYVDGPYQGKDCPADQSTNGHFFFKTVEFLE